MALWTRDGYLYTDGELNRMNVTTPETLGFTQVQDVIPVHNSFEVKMVRTNEVKDGFIVYIEEPLTDEEKYTKLKEYGKEVIMDVDMFMDGSIVDIKEFESRDAIGKFLVEGNPYYDICSKISLWIANCYIKCKEIEANVFENKNSIPTSKEVLHQLPKADFLTDEEQAKLIPLWEEKKEMYGNYGSIVSDATEVIPLQGE